jgi:hypothetical protein
VSRVEEGVPLVDTDAVTRCAGVLENDIFVAVAPFPALKERMGGAGQLVRGFDWFYPPRLRYAMVAWRIERIGMRSEYGARGSPFVILPRPADL